MTYLDDHFHIKNVFLANLKNKISYNFFGYAVTFNTIYLINNKYDMSFVAFVGVYHCD